ncbi:MAG: DUF3153 domain-containing protein [Cyanobium sp.]
MAERSLDPAVAATLAEARKAIERGEYGQSLRLLDPLAERFPPAGPVGAGVRLLMTTALMGMGESERAAACCRSLQICVDPTLRARARELQMVLDAPALRRPRQWSLTLPDLGGGTTLEGTGASPLRRRRQDPPPPPPPPVGDTRAPLGFAAVTLLLLTLLLIASLLGGCLQVSSELRFDGPGRLQVSHELQGATGRSNPWQARFQEVLLHRGLPFLAGGSQGSQRLSTPVLPAAEALAALAESLNAAAMLADVQLPPPQLSLHETNWLVGVRQNLSLDLDLTSLEPLPGLTLELRLSPVQPRAVERATPRAIRPAAGRRSDPVTLVWLLQPGERNQLELNCWRWSPLGLGGLLILLSLALVLLLQRIRLRLGFGLPELPA